MHILMATGGSPHSEAALRLGARLARGIDTPPTLLVVIEEEAQRATAEIILGRAREILCSEVPVVCERVRIGQPAREIVREASDGGYGLIVLGERAHHRLKTRLLKSSRAVYVAEHAPCPVMIVKQSSWTDPGNGDDGSAFRRILMCDSGGHQPSLLSRYTAQLAELDSGQEQITILHVMSQISGWPGVPGQQLRADAEELIRQGAPEGALLVQDLHELERTGVHSQPKVRHGRVVDEILAEARSGQYDLVVIGAHREVGWQRFLLDDLAHQNITQVDRPILVVR
jgi:nucleotide-binding universal stress UspA family protein